MKTLEDINSKPDEDLVKAIVETNDTLLFEVLYDRYATLVYNKCYGFARDEDEAKDLTQDVFLKLFVKLASFKGKSKFSTWLYAFTYNHCVNYVTRNTAKKIEKQSVDYQDIENVSDSEIEDKDFLNMRVDKLKKAMELISPDEKMILLLKYQDYLTIKEIESVLGIGESAVKMRIKRAKDKLKQVYSDN
ncbi:RNA polymerase sigma factor [Jejuia pallidilutea]|uniref:RNA polymerase sigma-70 factor n=1 Tax=Jejuia pallidilutea TaxID=504487 RepID=A0A090VVE1_9FLAO|nr:RNA polymerase sigma factor [Jejuia pallidilutea]PQV45071.1 RNA polymerase sigma-70 factor (ECF subfamily) [Jejuia pallidilutea]GAL68696.1 RNA polymerase sigma-70 factor [Jejuia pallidilutea]GAL72259.1 RNA polymerase sigma-70 factor [Jejuia pallidilutea]GAL89231.1 RNA polymerase sigma-70 factor [Jejuia pallidilutea]